VIILWCKLGADIIDLHPDYLEDVHTTNLEPEVDTNEAFEPISTLDTTSRFRIWSVGTFDEMEDDHRGLVLDRF
jgi:hypothetical protein